MLAKQLKNYLESVPDEANILVYTQENDDVRQLLFGDLDRTYDGNIVIDASYEPEPKITVAEKEEIERH